MVVVGREREGELALAQEVVVDDGGVDIAGGIAAGVEELEAPEAFVVLEVVVVEAGPRRMVEGDEEAVRVAFGDDAVRPLSRIIMREELPVVESRVGGALVVAPARPVGVVADVRQAVRVARQEIEVHALVLVEGADAGCGAAGGDFVAGDGQEGVVREDRVVVEKLVVGEGDDGIPVRLVDLLDLLGGHGPVGEARVAVEVGLVEVAGFRQEEMFHGSSIAKSPAPRHRPRLGLTV